MDTFGSLVVALRGTRGWSRRELAHRAGLHEQHLLKIERGLRTKLESPTIISLARVLEVSSDYLLGLTDDPRARRRKGLVPGEG